MNNINASNSNYFLYEFHDLKDVENKSEYEDRDQLAELIRHNDLEGLKKSPLFVKYEVNYRFGSLGETLLHIAYSFNKPDIVDWLLNNGASEHICSSTERPPMGYANKSYEDARPRVINQIVKKYFDKTHAKDPHVLFEVILKLIQKRKWIYIDSSIGARGEGPVRDNENVIKLGPPKLSYRVNCSDLSDLFYSAAKKIGIKAKMVSYGSYCSVNPEQLDTKKIFGSFQLFDGTAQGPFQFGAHCVVSSSGYFFDLTLTCKYTEKNAVLAEKK